MMIQKIIALLALLSALTGCGGADAAALRTVESGEGVAPYAEPAAPLIAEADAVLVDSESGGGTESVFPIEDRTSIAASGAEDGATHTENSASRAGDSAARGEDSAAHTGNGGMEAAPAEALAEGSVTADTTALYTPFSPYSGETLQPRGDYGILLPYAGGTSKDGGYTLWGLATDDGQVVTDPVYAHIKPYGPFLLLFKSEGESGTGESTLTVSGKDGSWTMDGSSFDHSILLDGIGMAAAMSDGTVIILVPDGIVTQTFTRAQMEMYLGAGYSWDDESREVCYAGGPIAVCRWDDDSPYGNGTAYDCFMNPVTGDITGEPPAGFAPENGFGELDEDPSFPGYDYPDRMEDIATGTVYYWGERDGVSDLLDSRGNVLMADFFTPGPGLWEPVIGAGLVGTIRDGAFQFAKIPSGEVVFRYPLRS